MNLNKLKISLYFLCIMNHISIFSQSKKAVKLINKAKLEMACSNYQGAINQLNQLLEKDDNNTEALFLRGICFDSLSQVTEALHDYNKVIAFSSNIQVYKNRALLRYRTGEILKGVLDLEKYCENNQKDKEAYFLIADGYSSLINYSKALFYYNKIIELDPYETDAYIFIGWIKFSNNDYNGSIIEYSKALEINPKSINAYVNRGLARERLKDYKGAISDLDEAIVAFTDSSNFEYKGEVKEIYMRISVNNNNNIPNYKFDVSLIYVNRAVLKMKNKDYQGATEDCNKAMELNHNLIEAYNTRGNIKIETKDYDGALKDFNAALEINSQHPLPLFNRGRLKYILGDLNGACSDLGYALKSVDNSELKDEIKGIMIDNCN